MDPASRRLIKQNELSIKNLDLDVLKPYLINAGIFTTSMLSDIFDQDTESDLFSELPSRGPNAFSQFLEVLEAAGYSVEANSLRNGPKNAEYDVRSVFYPMKSNPLGYCIIINNVKFHLNGIEVKEKRRKGSRVDARKLRKFFEKVGYVVEEKIDVRREEMVELLKELARSDVLKIVDCFFVIILSHGSKNDIVCDTHFSEIRKQEIYEIFNNVNCKNLRKKPKIVIFQTCRGGIEDSGIFSTESSEFSILSEESNNNYTVTDSTDILPRNFNPSPSLKLPTLSDFLVIHATLPDHVSYRHPSNGSWLIQDLLSVFVENYLDQDIETMLKTVSREIQGRLSVPFQKKQVLHTETFGFRALFHICSDDDYRGPNKSAISYLS